MKRRLSCFTSPLFVVPETAGKYEKWSLIPDRLRQIDPGEVMFDFRCPTPVSHTRLCYAHDETYVNQFLDGTLDEKIMRRIGLQWSRTLVESTLMFNGATVDAALSLFEEDEPKQSTCLAGGSHHAHFNYGSGYCVFNDIVVAAETLCREGLVRNYLVIDLDVHQGDGTATICQYLNSNNGRLEDHAFTFSMHSATNFPLFKPSSSMDISLADGMEDVEYLEQLRSSLQMLLGRFQQRTGFSYPDVIFYQAGVDPLQNDRLGRLKLTLEGLKQRDMMVYQFAKTNQVPIVVTMGGGYPKRNTMDQVIDAHCQTVKLLQQFL